MKREMKVVYQKVDAKGRISHDRTEKQVLSGAMAAALSKLADVACVVAYETEKARACYVDGALVQI